MSLHSFKYRFRSISEISPQILKEIGVKGVAVDLDNTLIYDGTLRLFENALSWTKSIKAANIPIIILSNATPIRASLAARKLGLDCISFARKPSPKTLFSAAEKLGVDISQLGMIGDQIFADVEAANTAGAIPLLVDPKEPEKYFRKHFTKIRNREKPLLDEFNKKTGYHIKK